MPNDQDQVARRLELLEAQVAGLAGAVAVLMASATPKARAHVRAAIGEQLEALQAVLLNDDSPHSEAGLLGVDNLRAALLPKGKASTGREGGR